MVPEKKIQMKGVKSLQKKKKERKKKRKKGKFWLNKSIIFRSIKSLNGPKILKSGTILEKNFLIFFFRK